MVKVLHKAFDVLEFLRHAADRARVLGEIATAVGLKPAGCAHILKTMVERGYVHQEAPRKGYVLGPMAVALSRGVSPFGTLARLAGAEMSGLACALGKNVVLSVLHQGRKIVLCEATGDQLVHIRHGDTLYETATGRILLAFASDAERATLLKRHGPPGKAWPELDDPDTAEDAVGRIRRAGHVAVKTEQGVLYLACPVSRGDQVVAALGVALLRYGLTKGGERSVLKTLAESAVRLGKALETSPGEEEAP